MQLARALLQAFMSEDTKIGGPGSGRFPSTRWSAVVAARSGDTLERRRGLDAILTTYWKPVYKYIRIRWGKSNEDAKDLTQGFFARLIEKDFLGGFDPGKARLRTFLRVCADGHVANEAKSAQRMKRGGDAVHLSLDFEGAEAELERARLPGSPSASVDAMEDLFEREWARSLFSYAVEELRRECEQRGKHIQFRLFEMYDLEDDNERRTSYAELARQFGIAVTDVTNYLAFARRGFRRIVLERLREMTTNEQEFRREARALLGVEPE
jgi:RNA polymerase sigma factor (sigma-70 family)